MIGKFSQSGYDLSNRTTMLSATGRLQLLPLSVLEQFPDRPREQDPGQFQRMKLELSMTLMEERRFSWTYSCNTVRLYWMTTVVIYCHTNLLEILIFEVVPCSKTIINVLENKQKSQLHICVSGGFGLEDNQRFKHLLDITRCSERLSSDFILPGKWDFLKQHHWP